MLTAGATFVVDSLLPHYTFQIQLRDSGWAEFDSGMTAVLICDSWCM